MLNERLKPNDRMQDEKAVFTRSDDGRREITSQGGYFNHRPGRTTAIELPTLLLKYRSCTGILLNAQVATMGLPRGWRTTLMLDKEFGDSFQASAHQQQLEGDWWIIPSLLLLIEQVEFSLALSNDRDQTQGSEKIAGNITVLTDHPSQGSLRNNALKISNMWLRETLQFLIDVNASTYSHQIDHQKIDRKPTNMSRRA